MNGVYSSPELWAIGAIPTDDLVEFAQSFAKGMGDIVVEHEVKLRGGKRFDPVGKLNQGHDGWGDPDFGEIGFRKLQGREGQDAIAKRARTYEQPPDYSITTGSLISRVAGRKHISLLQA